MPFNYLFNYGEADTRTLEFLLTVQSAEYLEELVIIAHVEPNSVVFNAICIEFARI